MSSSHDVGGHELCHERLLGEGHVTAEKADHEPLADHATVFFGFGIFTANAAFHFEQNNQAWQTRRLGYLTQPIFGYALACYAWLRGEREPSWARHLHTNPRSYLKQGLAYLRQIHAPGHM